MFQFQTGAIKRRLALEAELQAQEFQFQTGAIKSGALATRDVLEKSVSIPNWCD